MRILAIESSGKAASVALCDGNSLKSQYFQNSGLTHSRTLLVMTEDMLNNLDLSVSDVDLIAVSNGPGSFTGVRIGVSAAKGLAWGADKLICGVSSLEAMAYHIESSDVVICPVMDARRNQVYNAKFERTDSLLTRLCPDRAIGIDELIREAEGDKKPYFLLGDGAEMCYNQFVTAGISVFLAPIPIRFQSAWGVARAALRGKHTSPDDLVPNYLRLSQAERERLKKQNDLDKQEE